MKKNVDYSAKMRNTTNVSEVSCLSKLLLYTYFKAVRRAVYTFGWFWFILQWILCKEIQLFRWA